MRKKFTVVLLSMLMVFASLPFVTLASNRNISEMLDGQYFATIDTSYTYMYETYEGSILSQTIIIFFDNMTISVDLDGNSLSVNYYDHSLIIEMIECYLIINMNEQIASVNMYTYTIESNRHNQLISTNIYDNIIFAYDYIYTVYVNLEDQIISVDTISYEIFVNVNECSIQIDINENSVVLSTDDSGHVSVDVIDTAPFSQPGTGIIHFMVRHDFRNNNHIFSGQVILVIGTPSPLAKLTMDLSRSTSRGGFRHQLHLGK